MAETQLPQTHRALVVRDVNIEPKIEIVPVPECLAGTAILKVVVAPVISYTKGIFLGNSRGYTLPLPLVPGTSAICRIAEVSSDCTIPSLKVGTLVYFDCVIRSRSDPSVKYLSAIHDGYTPASKALMANGPFRDGSYAEYMRAPLENVYVLDEAKLLESVPKGLGYEIAELGQIAKSIIPFGGLRSVGVVSGETVLVSNATAPFGSAACMVALAMGANVIAWARKEEKLKNMLQAVKKLEGGRYAGRLQTLVTHESFEDNVRDLDKVKESQPIDVYFDISPLTASGSSHIKAGIMALRNSGRVSLMGGIRDDVPIPHDFVMHNDIMIKGKWMYDRDDIPAFLQLVNKGFVSLRNFNSLDTFELDDWKQAWMVAAEKNGAGQMVAITPST